MNPFLTNGEAGKLSQEEARKFLGPWWFGNEGGKYLETPEGRAVIYRTWLRYQYNNDSSPVPTDVFRSFAQNPRPGPEDYLSHDWFTREVWKRDYGWSRYIPREGSGQQRLFASQENDAFKRQASDPHCREVSQPLITSETPAMASGIETPRGPLTRTIKAQSEPLKPQIKRSHKQGVSL